MNNFKEKKINYEIMWFIFYYEERRIKILLFWCTAFGQERSVNFI